MTEKNLEEVMEDKIYTTVLGDTWDSISYKLYNNSYRFKELIELNPEQQGVFLFKAGTKIRYKDIAENQNHENIPPWRR